MMRGWIAGVLSAAATMAVPAYAQACDCAGGVVIVRPDDGEPHPANAALRFGGCSDNLFTYTAAVDGAPATLSWIEDTWVYTGLVAITPTPQPGQEVVVTQCSDEPQPFECPDPPQVVEVLRYTAGPVDRQPPPAVGSVALGHTFDRELVGCGGPGDLVFHVQVSELDQGSELDVRYRVELHTGSSGHAAHKADRWVTRPTTELSFDLPQHLDTITLPFEEVCVTVTAMDLAGNVTPIAETCGSTPPDDPAGTDSSGDGTSGVPPDATTDDDGGPSPTTTTGEIPAGTTDGPDPDIDNTTGRGCACRTTDSAPPPALGLFALALLALRRRRAASIGGLGAAQSRFDRLDA